MELQIVKREIVLGKEFTVYGDFENPLFLAKDVAEWIEHSDTSKMLQSIDDDEKVKSVCDTNIIRTTSNKARNTQEMWFLTENGLYEVLMLSRKPIAKQFKKEVKRILHEIRTTGGYTVPRSFEEALRLAADQQKKIEEQARLIEEQKPLAEGFTEYIDRGRFCNFRDAANYYRVPQKELMDLLKSKYIYKNSVGEYRCYAEYTELFALRPYAKGDVTRQQLMLTAAGLNYFGRILGEIHKERQEEIRKSAMEAAQGLLASMGGLCPVRNTCKEVEEPKARESA